eukprot:11211160-Karenia_brevis.AAC.1
MDDRQSVYVLTPRLAKGIKLQKVARQAWVYGRHRQKGCSSAAAVVKAWHEDRQRPWILVAV